MRSATRKPEPKLVAAIAPFCENSPSGKPRGTRQGRLRVQEVKVSVLQTCRASLPTRTLGVLAQNFAPARADTS